MNPTVDNTKKDRDKRKRADRKAAHKAKVAAAKARDAEYNRVAPIMERFKQSLESGKATNDEAIQYMHALGRTYAKGGIPLYNAVHKPWTYDTRIKPPPEEQ